MAASALRTLCAPTSGSSKLPNGEPPRRTLNRVEARPAPRDRAPASRRLRPGRTSRRATPPRPRARARAGLSAPTSSRPLRGTRLTRPPERQRHGVEVGVDVRVIELDVVDDGDVRQILQELRRLVEEGAVVLVALDDEVAPLADAVARARRRRSCARCRRRARSDRRRRASAATPPATSSSSCRACRR